MKPLILKMKAFGSYAEETTVNFDELNTGLYLITGDTGAGKTTIFDAMVYALYGEASGTGREGSMLHSDYVDKSVDTVVTLEFIHQDKKYKVERTIHYSKNQNGSGYSDTPQPKAILHELDTNVVLEKSKKVTARITEILGLDVNQFKQIIVLAQGEFQKFLTASSEERNEILGKLFDNSPYVRFQNRLKEASKEVENKVKNEMNEIEIKMKSFDYPEGEDELLYSFNHPNCIENIQELVEKEKQNLEEIGNEIGKQNEKKSDITSRKVKAEYQNKELDSLHEQENKYKELVSHQEENDALDCTLKNVEEIYNRVTPIKEEYEKNKERYQNNEIQIKNKSIELEEKEKQKNELEKEYLKIDGLRKENEKLSIQSENLNKELESFKPLKEKKLEYQLEFNKQKLLSEEVNTLEVEKKEIEKEKEIISNEKISLKEDIKKYTERKISLDEAIKKYNALVSKDGLITKYHLIEEMKNSIKLDETNLLQKTQETRDKNKKYSELNEAFLKGQASILAKELKVKLENEEEATCPVCQSHLIKCDCSRLVIKEDELISKETVDEAKKELEKAEKEQNNLYTNLESKKSKLEADKHNALEYASQMNLVIDCFEDLSEEYLSNLKKELLEEKTEKEKIFTLSEKAKKDEQKYEETLKELEQKHKENSASYDKKKKELDAKNILVTKIKTELESIEQKLQGHTEEDTNKKIQDVTNQIKTNESTINRITKSYENVQTEYSRIHGSLEELQKANKTYKEELEASLKRYQTALTENKLKEEEDYNKAIAIALPDIRKWISHTRENIQNYRNELKSSCDRLSEQREKCKEYAYVDLDSLQQELNAVIDKINALTVQKEESSKHYNNHESTLKFLEEKNENIQKYTPAKNRLAKLSSLANATVNTVGGKITFDRYVMGNAFAEILDAANVHLSVMAAGEFELIHQTRGEGASSQAGLGIDVLDVFTGEQRKPETLSGGEKFQVSMSLALGLSDVVQNHAGGKKIDTMYIDEGFGTLDESVLSKAIEVLNNIAGENRQIGIISHVERLEESISQKIVVTKTDKGSSLKIVK